MQTDEPKSEVALGDAEWRCQECTILIGEAYQEKYPFRSPFDRRTVVCWRCYESLLRRKERQAARAAQSEGV